MPAASVLAVASGGPSTQRLQYEKLLQQIRQLQLANQGAASPWHYLISLAPALVGVAAVLTFGLGWATQRSESRRQRQQDLAQRKAEASKQFDTNFAQVVANLGSDSLSLQASAASMLGVFADGRYTEFDNHIVRVVIANLRISRDQVIKDLLVDVLGTALRRIVGEPAHQDEPTDLSWAYLGGLNLSGARFTAGFAARNADLTASQLDGCDLWKADLQGAMLERSTLGKANIGQARLDGARLSHAVLRGSQATSASFRNIDGRYLLLQGASLQSAHFENADLRGARFEGSNLADCYFQTAKLDDGCLESILHARNSGKAHFDDEQRSRLEEQRSRLSAAQPG